MQETCKDNTINNTVLQVVGSYCKEHRYNKKVDTIYPEKVVKLINQ